MPRVAIQIPDTYNSIIRPIALATIRRVCELLALPKDTQILLPGGSEQTPQPGSTLNYEGEPSQFNSAARVTAEVSEETLEDRVLGTPVYQQENVPYFVDNDLGVRLYPVYSATELVIQFSYRAANRVTARQFRDFAVMRTAQGRQEHVHELDYHYPVPYEYLHLLKHIHTLREAQAGYGEDFSHWMKQSLSAKATNLTTVTGTRPQLVIAENQIRPLGWFEFNAQPAPEQKDNDTGTWIVTFEYRLTFDKVIGSVAQYPLVVHNQLIDSEWHGTRNASGDVLNPEHRKGVAAYGRYAMDHIVDMNTPACKPPDGVRIPQFDEWAPATVHPSTRSLATIMLQVSPADKRDVIDLKDMGDFTLDPFVMEFLKAEAPYLNRFTQSVVYLSLYRGNVPIEDGSLLIDENLIVRSNREMDLREDYHLRLALVTDLTYLSPGAFERLRSSGQACLNILSTLQWVTRREGFLPKLLGGQYVSRADMLEIASRINENRPAPRHVLAMQTVGNFLIQTDRMTNYAHHDTQAVSASGEGTASGESGRTPISERDAYC